MDFSPWVFDTWGGLQKAGAEVWKAVLNRTVTGLVGSARAQAVTAIRRGLVVAVMRGIAVQLELMSTTGPPGWPDEAGDVLTGIQVDDAGNELPHLD